jgi:hypothetical protein
MNLEILGSTSTVATSTTTEDTTITHLVSGDTTSTTPLTYLNKNILCSELFRDVTNFCNKDKQVNADIFIETYFTFASNFCTNRVIIQVGNRKAINGNNMLTIIANSGKGKGYVFKFFYKPILEIQKNLIERDNLRIKFIKSCRAYSNRKPDATEEEKLNFAKGFYYKYKMNNPDNAVFALDDIVPEIFTVTSFTPESLAVNFSQSKNNTILLCFDEFEKLKENIGRTRTVENIYSYTIEYIDGNDEIITRKTNETISSTDARLSLIVGTVPETFEKLKTTELYSSGLGYRGDFLIVDEINTNDLEKVQKAENGMSAYDEYKAKFANIFETFFYGLVYNTEKLIGFDCPKNVLRINDVYNLNVYEECRQKLWTEFIKNNDDLTDRQKETFRNRLDTKFSKGIYKTYVGNYGYSDGSEFPMHSKEIIDLTELDILRGYEYTRVNLSKATIVFSTNVKSNLPPKQLKAIETLEIGKSVLIEDFKKNTVDKNILTLRTFRTLTATKTDQFTFSRSFNKIFITRNF